MGKVWGNRYQCGGAEALMRTLNTPPSARRYRSLFVNMYAPGLNEITYSMMPQNLSIYDFPRWERGFRWSRFTRRPRREPSDA